MRIPVLVAGGLILLIRNMAELKQSRLAENRGTEGKQLQACREWNMR